MGNETILYYVVEEFITGCKRTEKIHFWQKIKLPSFVVEGDNITIVTIMIPTLKKGWKREKLLKQMQEAAAEYPMYSGNAQIMLHPDVQRLLTEQEELASGKRSSAADSEAVPASGGVPAAVSHMEWRMAEEILRKKFFSKHLSAFPESVVLLLGDTLFLEEQMQKFQEMMQPYFSRMNHLLILYKADEEGWQEQNRWDEVISEYTDEIYYEYGLVVQVQQDSGQTIKQHSVRIAQGKALFLDYGYPKTLPLRALRDGDFYLDFFSSEEKEALFRRKYMENSYSSPRKYLDTIVKSGYDKLVHQVLDKNRDIE